MTTISNGSAAQPNSEELANLEAAPNQEASPRQQSFVKNYKFHTKNLLSASAIFFALMLIVGAIFLHIRQKSHFGRMHIELRHKLPDQNESDIVLPLEMATEPSVAALRTELVSDDCLECIAITRSFNKPIMCGKTVCGIYGISRPYWQDAMRTLNLPGVEDYESCVSNPDCGAAIVRSYMKTYNVDCDGDGSIGCKDHIMLHLQGPTGCVIKPLADRFRTRMNECLRVKKLE